MPRVPLVPETLRSRPFTLEEARRAGIQRWHLEGAVWKRLGPGVYRWVGLDETPMVALAAAQLRMPRNAVFSGRTAAWLHELPVEPCDPIEISVPPGGPTSLLKGLRVRRVALRKSEVGLVGRFRVTSVERTIADLSSDLSLTEVVVLGDAATHARRTTIKRLEEAAERAAGRPGADTLRRAIVLIEPATESPMETRLRMVIVLSGLPPPAVQEVLLDSTGHFLARPDLYYPHAKLAIEYDGEVHETSLAADNRRQNRMVASGIRLLRFTAGDIYNDPEKVVAQVRAMLATAAGERSSATSRGSQIA